jgi:hypothetical protein
LVKDNPELEFKNMIFSALHINKKGGLMGGGAEEIEESEHEKHSNGDSDEEHNDLKH